MIKKAIIGFIGMFIFVFGANATIFGKESVMFKVHIENVSPAQGLAATDGTRYPFALSPGLFVVSKNGNDLFKSGKDASEGLERQAEDGNPEILAKSLLTSVGSANMGIFNTPVGATQPGPILPGGAFEFTFSAKEGMKLNLITMYGQSNDLFYAPLKAIDLFTNGQPLTGDITDRLMLWDAGTEVNQAPGIGADQAPRQKSANTGAAETMKIGPVKDSFSYPNTREALKVTITRL